MSENVSILTRAAKKKLELLASANALVSNDDDGNDDDGNDDDGNDDDGNDDDGNDDDGNDDNDDDDDWDEEDEDEEEEDEVEEEDEEEEENEVEDNDSDYKIKIDKNSGSNDDAQFNTHIYFNDSNGTNAMPVIILRMAPPESVQEQSNPLKRSVRSASIDSQRDARIKNPRLANYSADEKAYYNTLSVDDQLTVNTVEAMVHEQNHVKIPMRFKVLMSNIDPHIQSIAIKKVDYLSKMSPNNGEYFKMTNWIESLCRIPIGKYAGLPIFKTPSTPAMNDISAFLLRTQSILDSAVYGHTDSKDQIIRFLAQWIVNPNTKGSVIGIHGPPGVGKTTLVKEGICRALEIPFGSISLSGSSDASYLDGHSYTYEGSTWGRIVSVLMEAQCMNPLLYMDEVDKLSGHKSNEVTSILIHLTDPAQNTAFSDKYFSDVPIDLSRSIMVFTYNDPELVSPILRDRMISIEVKPYNDGDKLEIARKHLIPSLCVQFKFDKNDVVISDSVIKLLINMVPEEDGVRSLRRALEHIFSNINLERLILDTKTGVPKYKLPITVTETVLCDLAKKLPSKRERELVLPMYT
jgi:ATP-dependent Lon protease